MRNFEFKKKRIFLLLSICCVSLTMNNTTIHAENELKYSSSYSFLRSLNAGNTITLTRNTPNQKYAIFDQTKLNLDYDFDLSFSVNLGNNQNGGEGLAFILHNDSRGLNAIGDGGECLGVYQCFENGDYIRNSVALEFDTNYNNNSLGSYGSTDITVNSAVNSSKSGHIAITIPNQKTTNHYNVQYNSSNILANGNSRNVNVRWNAQTKQLVYTVEGFPQQVHSLTDYMSVFNGNTVYWGFSGATSSLTNTQSVTIQSRPVQRAVINAYTSKDNGTNWSQNLSVNPRDTFLVKLEINVPNSGISPTITLPNNAAFVVTSVSSSDTSTSLSNDKKTLTLGALAPGSKVSILLNYAVKSSTNQATLTYSLTGGTISGSSNNIIISSTNLYSINYNANGGSNQPVDTANYESGSLVSVLPPGQMTNGNMAFTGWNTRADGSGTAYLPGSQVSLKNSITLYAQWSSQSVKLTIDWNHPSITNGQESFNVNKAQMISLQSFAKRVDDSTLTGFNTQKNGSGTQYRLNDAIRFTSDTTLYAQWTERHLITVTFDVGKFGKLNDTEKIEIYSGESLNIIPTLEVTEPSITFEGWSYEGNIIDLNTYQFIEDSVVVATYAINGLSLTIGESLTNSLSNQLILVTFQSGDHGTLEYETFLYPSNHVLSSRPFVTPHEGYTFIGWSIDDSMIDIETYTVTEPITLIAEYDTASEAVDQSIKNDLVHIRNKETTQQIMIKILIIALAAILIIVALRSDVRSAKKKREG